MTHPAEEQLVEAYYTGLDAQLKQHLNICPDCEAVYRSISETLDTACDPPILTRGEDYGSQVWQRLLPNLSPKTNRRPMRFLIPALAALLAIVVLAVTLPKHKSIQPALAVSGQQISPPVPVTTFQQQPPVTRRKVAAKTNQHLRSLARSKSPSAEKELTGIYTSSSDQLLKKEILTSVVSTGDANEVVTLVRQEKDPGRRVSAVNSLAALPAQGHLFTTLYFNEPSDEVRKALLNALAKQQNRKALLDLANQETDMTRKSEILNHLEKIQNTTNTKARYTSEWR